MLNKIKKDGADQSFYRSLLPIVQRQPELFGRHAQVFRGSSAYTVLLDLARRMASLIMAYGLILRKRLILRKMTKKRLLVPLNQPTN